MCVCRVFVGHVKSVGCFGVCRATGLFAWHHKTHHKVWHLKIAMIRCIMERGRLGGMNFKGVNELVYEKLWFASLIAAMGSS